MVFLWIVFFVKVCYVFLWIGMLFICILDLKMNFFVIEFDCFYFEIYVNCVEVSFFVGEIDVMKKKIWFFYVRIFDYKNFE